MAMGSISRRVPPHPKEKANFRLLSFPFFSPHGDFWNDRKKKNKKKHKGAKIKELGKKCDYLGYFEFLLGVFSHLLLSC